MLDDLPPSISMCKMREARPPHLSYRIDFSSRCSLTTQRRKEASSWKGACTHLSPYTTRSLSLFMTSNGHLFLRSYLGSSTKFSWPPLCCDNTLPQEAAISILTTTRQNSLHRPTKSGDGQEKDQSGSSRRWPAIPCRVGSSCTCCHKLNLGELYRTVQLLSCSSCLFRLRSWYMSSPSSHITHISSPNLNLLLHILTSTPRTP